MSKTVVCFAQIMSVIGLKSVQLLSVYQIVG